jgi:hypothetical protein
MDSAATARISTPTKIDGRRLGEGAFFLLMLSGGAAGLLASVNGGLGADCVWMSGFGIFIAHSRHINPWQAPRQLPRASNASVDQWLWRRSRLRIFFLETR